MERDTGIVAYSDGTSTFLGRVAYTNGPEIDRPLGFIRMDYSTYLPEPEAIYPHRNWRGQIDEVTFRDGRNERCNLLVSPGTVTTNQYCIEVVEPANSMSMIYTRTDQSGQGAAWIGGQLDNMRDASGQLYMRNRYYDPESGRFTQEDPIGIAGGLNLYGYANGDPVHFSDPYGLAAVPLVALLYGMFEAASTTYDVWQASRTVADEDASGSDKAFSVAGVVAGLATPGPGSAYVAGGRRLANGFVRDFATNRTRNWSAQFGSERAARTFARERIGRNPVQVEPGKWRSADGKWQYRAKPNDLADNHIHIEELNPTTGEVLQNVHLRWE